MKKILKQSNLAALLLFGLITKGFIEPSSLADSISIFAMSLLFGFKLYLDHVEIPDYSKEFTDKLDKVEKERDIQLQQMAELYEQRIKTVENKVSTLNLTITKKGPSEVAGKFGW